MSDREKHRFFLKDSIRKSIHFRSTDQNQGIPAPPIEKPFDPNAHRIPLLPVDQWMGKISKTDVVAAMSNRRSRRRFTSGPLSLSEMSFLLWATQGIRQLSGGNPAYRIVPSAGARHSFETYLFIMHVDQIPEGLYRYLPVENELLFITEVDRLKERLTQACLGQTYAAGGAVTFVWTTIPYRMEWRYDLSAHRVILIDAGHVCQNLYLACEAIGAGTCAIGAYDQEQLDALLKVDGIDEFVIYLAPVGKLP